MFFAANSSAKASTPLPMTTPLTAPEVAAAICCAATSVSKLVLFHFPCRCSVMTSIFMSDHPRFELQLLYQLGGHFFGGTGQELRLLRLCWNVNLFYFLGRLSGDPQRF